ncbi:hypothetical protein FVE85_3719 [Porphyridium purpureum]|uniref:Exocyst complex component Sec3 PIP2-binding N-terminal domain-containing protein n=1 Tax=Porphyridium purpureum TaxID=35688 RepID=A0A5J4YLC1_PORPP|nr:hypothetical protein FVE85_3719 [Porphyridium purpureum]|eukprot:POR2961..scf249_10
MAAMQGGARGARAPLARDAARDKMLEERIGKETHELIQAVELGLRGAERCLFAVMVRRATSGGGVGSTSAARSSSHVTVPAADEGRSAGGAWTPGALRSRSDMQGDVHMYDGPAGSGRIVSSGEANAAVKSQPGLEAGSERVGGKKGLSLFSMNIKVNMPNFMGGNNQNRSSTARKCLAVCETERGSPQLRLHLMQDAPFATGKLAISRTWLLNDLSKVDGLNAPADVALEFALLFSDTKRLVWVCDSPRDRAIFLWGLLQTCASRLSRAPPVEGLRILELQEFAQACLNVPVTQPPQTSKSTSGGDGSSAQKLEFPAESASGHSNLASGVLEDGGGTAVSKSGFAGLNDILSPKMSKTQRSVGTRQPSKKDKEKEKLRRSGGLLSPGGGLGRKFSSSENHQSVDTSKDEQLGVEQSQQQQSQQQQPNQGKSSTTGKLKNLLRRGAARQRSSEQITNLFNKRRTSSAGTVESEDGDSETEVHEPVALRVSVRPGAANNGLQRYLSSSDRTGIKEKMMSEESDRKASEDREGDSFVNAAKDASEATGMAPYPRAKSEKIIKVTTKPPLDGQYVQGRASPGGSLVTGGDKSRGTGTPSDLKSEVEQVAFELEQRRISGDGAAAYVRISQSASAHNMEAARSRSSVTSASIEEAAGPVRLDEMDPDFLTRNRNAAFAPQRVLEYQLTREELEDLEIIAEAMPESRQSRVPAQSLIHLLGGAALTGAISDCIRSSEKAILEEILRSDEKAHVTQNILSELARTLEEAEPWLRDASAQAKRGYAAIEIVQHQLYVLDVQMHNAKRLQDRIELVTEIVTLPPIHAKVIERLTRSAAANTMQKLLLEESYLTSAVIPALSVLTDRLTFMNRNLVLQELDIVQSARQKFTRACFRLSPSLELFVSERMDEDLKLRGKDICTRLEQKQSSSRHPQSVSDGERRGRKLALSELNGLLGCLFVIHECVQQDHLQSMPRYGGGHGVGSGPGSVAAMRARSAAIQASGGASPVGVGVLAGGLIHAHLVPVAHDDSSIEPPIQASRSVRASVSPRKLAGLSSFDRIAITSGTTSSGAALASPSQPIQQRDGIAAAVTNDTRVQQLFQGQAFDSFGSSVRFELFTKEVLDMDAMATLLAVSHAGAISHRPAIDVFPAVAIDFAASYEKHFEANVIAALQGMFDEVLSKKDPSAFALQPRQAVRAFINLLARTSVQEELILFRIFYEPIVHHLIFHTQLSRSQALLRYQAFMWVTLCGMFQSPLSQFWMLCERYMSETGALGAFLLYTEFKVLLSSLQQLTRTDMLRWCSKAAIPSAPDLGVEAAEVKKAFCLTYINLVLRVLESTCKHVFRNALNSELARLSQAADALHLVSSTAGSSLDDSMGLVPKSKREGAGHAASSPNGTAAVPKPSKVATQRLLTERASVASGEAVEEQSPGSKTKTMKKKGPPGANALSVDQNQRGSRARRGSSGLGPNATFGGIDKGLGVAAKGSLKSPAVRQREASLAYFETVKAIGDLIHALLEAGREVRLKYKERCIMDWSAFEVEADAASAPRDSSSNRMPMATLERKALLTGAPPKSQHVLALETRVVVCNLLRESMERMISVCMTNTDVAVQQYLRADLVKLQAFSYILWAGRGRGGTAGGTAEQKGAAPACLIVEWEPEVRDGAKDEDVQVGEKELHASPPVREQPSLPSGDEIPSEALKSLWRVQQLTLTRYLDRVFGRVFEKLQDALGDPPDRVEKKVSRSIADLMNVKSVAQRMYSMIESDLDSTAKLLVQKDLWCALVLFSQARLSAIADSLENRALPNAALLVRSYAARLAKALV